jgi:DNA polymerase-3 subunit epsilon
MRNSAEGGGCFPTGKHYPGIAHLLRIVAAGLADEFDAGVEMSDLPVVSIDTETTGRDPSVDRIVEIACVVWHQEQVVQSHRWLLDPGRPIPKEAFDVHGIGDDDVRGKPRFAEITGELLACLAGHVPLAYNAEFDRAFLIDELARAGVERSDLPPAARRGVEWIDPLTWARELQEEEKGKSLVEVSGRLGIDIAQAHRATDDAEAAARVMGTFFGDARVPKTYGAFIQEQRRLARLHAEDRAQWRGGRFMGAAPPARA